MLFPLQTDYHQKLNFSSLVTLKLPDLLGSLAVVPPLRVEGALNHQDLLLQLGLFSIYGTAPLLQLPVQALQLAHRLGHFRVAFP